MGRKADWLKIVAWPEVAVVAILIVCNLPHAAGSVVPFHDQMTAFEIFYYFYDQVYFCGALPRWVPEFCYGAPAAPFQIGGLGPCDYLVLPLGRLLQVEDALQVFKFSLFLHELLFVGGILWWGRLCYRSAWTRFLIGAAAALTLSWWQQPWFNMDAFYLLPAVLALLTSFFRSVEPRRLYLAGIVLTCSMIGNVAYLAPLYVLLLAVFCVPQFPSLWMRWRGRPVAQIAASWLRPTLGLLIVVAVVVVGYTADALRGLEILTEGRDAESGAVSVQYYLNFSRLSLANAFFGYTTGALLHADNTYYIGLLPLCLFGYALVAVRDRAFAGLAAATIGLAWFSVGGELTRWLYHFPLMNLFRHVGLVHGIVKTLLLLAAGFGLDRLIGVVQGVPVPPLPPLRQRALVLLLFAELIGGDLYFSWRPHDVEVFDWHLDWRPLCALRVALYAAFGIGGLISWRSGRAASRWLPRRYSPLLVAIPFLFDVASFKAAMLLAIPRLTPELVARADFRVHPPAFRMFRTEEPPDERSRTLLEVLERPLPYLHRNYQISHALLGFDPCVPKFRTNLICRSVSRMLRARDGHPTQWPKEDYVPQHDAAFMRSLGCHAPKLRFAPAVIYAADADEAKRIFAATADPFHTVVISGAATTPELPAESAAQAASSISVSQFAANRLVLQADNQTTSARWLVYADAAHPGWQAAVDGHPQAIAHANLGFKALLVPPGQSTIVLRFEPGARKYLGLAFAAIGCAFAAVASVVTAGALIRPRGDSVADGSPLAGTLPDGREAPLADGRQG